MTHETPQPDLRRLKDEADRALMRGDLRTARERFIQATGLAPDQLQLWLGLAGCQRALGEPVAAIEALQGALRIDPRCFPALLMKGSLLEAVGEHRTAAITYGNALKVKPASHDLTEPMKRAVAHAVQVRDAYAEELATHLRAAIGLKPDSIATPDGRRVEAFIGAMVGRRKIYHQEPVEFHYPGMPAIEFHDRACFPWIEALEAYTDAIREEARSVLRNRAADLTAYVNYPDGMPLDQWAELNRNLDWSAFHLFKDGQPLEVNCRQCPATMEAIALIDQPHVPGRSPAAMFSILKPHTRIPPHTGVANTRLVLHLPLIVPDSCGFRVGGDIREWREGEAWVFDDTIDHEAWNHSDSPRTILICDVWSPSLSPLERDLIARLTGELDRFNGGVPSGPNL